MKLIKQIISASLILLFFSMATWAADKNKATINLTEPATVGSTQLPAGEYKLTWNGSGPNAEVTFSHGRDAVSVAAKLIEERNPFQSPAVHLKSGGDGGRVITQIQLRNLSLVFADEQQTSVGSRTAE